jgi:hypothetical protein
MNQQQASELSRRRQFFEMARAVGGTASIANGINHHFNPQGYTTNQAGPSTQLPGVISPMDLVNQPPPTMIFNGACAQK